MDQNTVQTLLQNIQVQIQTALSLFSQTQNIAAQPVAVVPALPEKPKRKYTKATRDKMRGLMKARWAEGGDLYEARAAKEAAAKTA